MRDMQSAPIPGYERYSATRDGRIFRGDREIRQRQNEKGYSVVTLQIDGRPVISKVHRLVAMTYLSLPPFPGAHCRHLDGNNRNNLVENLAWGTCDENAADRKAHGGYPSTKGHISARLDYESAQLIRVLKGAGTTYDCISESFGIKHEQIRRILRNKVWTGQWSAPTMVWRKVPVSCRCDKCSCVVP